MELKNFDGSAVELIDAYIDESPAMDEKANEKFDYLITAIIRGSDISTLLDVFSDLDLKSAYLNSKINTLDLELGNRKSKLRGQLYEPAPQNEEVVKLTNQINERTERQELYRSMEIVTSAIKNFTEESLVKQINNLTEFEKLELTQNFNEVIEANNLKLDTLSREITSREARIATKSSLQQEAELWNLTPSQYLVKINSELREKIQNRDIIEHYNQVVSRFYPTTKSKEDLRTILK